MEGQWSSYHHRIHEESIEEARWELMPCEQANALKYHISGRYLAVFTLSRSVHIFDILTNCFSQMLTLYLPPILAENDNFELFAMDWSHDCHHFLLVGGTKEQLYAFGWNLVSNSLEFIIK